MVNGGTGGRREFLRTGVAGGLGLAFAGTASASCAAPHLPQDDPYPRARRRRLERTRSLYTYDFSRIPGVPMVERLTAPDFFSLPWLREAFDRAGDLLENFVGSRRGEHRRASGPLRALFSANALDAGRLLDVAHRAAAAAGGDRPGSLEDYDAIFRTIELPTIAETFHEDRVFARQRVAGANPLVIRRVDRLDDRFPVSEALYRAVRPGDRLEAAAADGRLYLADYRALDGVELGLFRGVPKFLAAPLALFAVTKRSRELVPVAIQCGQIPGPHNPIFTPRDGAAWTMAKTIVQIADANHHEAVSHLGRTHLFVEPFVIATERQLAQNHPLRLLLRPHFEGTLAINEFAHSILLRRGGFVDELLAGTLEASTALAVEGVRSHPFEDAMLPRELARRGVGDPDALPDYPYRDDALLYWRAIREWVEDYLRLYYRSPADIRDDFELANWYRELAAHDGGRVAGFGRDGSVGSFEELVEAVTLLLFTSSVQHAAVNFPQFDLMCYVPNMPLAGFAPAPTSFDATEQDVLDLLPPLASARSQLVILYFLGTIHHTRLGAYDERELCDPRLRRPLAKFREELQRIGETLRARNESRPPYPFLDPAGLPQSINI